VSTAIGASASSIAEVPTSTRRSASSPLRNGVVVARLTTTPTRAWLTSRKTAPPATSAGTLAAVMRWPPPSALETPPPAASAIAHWPALNATLMGALRRARSATTDASTSTSTPMAVPASSIRA